MRTFEDAKLFEPIERYFIERSQAHEDIYGWGVLQGAPHPVARFLLDHEAVEVPSEIEGISIEVLRVSRPEPL